MLTPAFRLPRLMLTGHEMTAKCPTGRVGARGVEVRSIHLRSNALRLAGENVTEAEGSDVC